VHNRRVALTDIAFEQGSLHELSNPAVGACIDETPLINGMLIGAGAGGVIGLMANCSSASRSSFS
jgi:hypothetical protein